VLMYHLCYRQRLPRPAKAHLIGVIIFILIALPWFLIVLLSVPHAMEFWRYESIGQISDNTEKARLWWYYLPNLLQISLPWTPIWLLGLIFPFRFPKRRRFFAIASSALIVLVFSLSYVKKNAYLLPMMPLQTLIVAQGLIWLTVMFRRDSEYRPVRIPLRRTTIVAAIFAVLVQILVSGLFAYQDNHRSAKDACRLVMSLMNDSPRRSLLVSHLPEEAAVYLPIDLHDSKNSDEVLLIADDRLKQADAEAHQITTTPSGPVVSIESVEIPHPRSARWKVFKLKIAQAPPIPSSGPTSAQSHIPKPSTSSSGSPTSRGSF